MTTEADKKPSPPVEQDTLHEEALRHYGQRFFAEAKNLAAADEAEFDAWRREQREKRPWWAGGGEPAKS